MTPDLQPLYDALERAKLAMWAAEADGNTQEAAYWLREVQTIEAHIQAAKEA